MKKIMRMRENKGFTLAELLIVVAIIAVLVAISIPIFTAQLEKARDATSVANIRSAYAEASASLLTEEAANGNVTVTKGATGVTSIAVKGVMIQTAQANSWSGSASSLPITIADPGSITSNTDYTITFTITNGEIASASMAATPTP